MFLSRFQDTNNHYLYSNTIRHLYTHYRTHNEYTDLLSYSGAFSWPEYPKRDCQRPRLSDQLRWHTVDKCAFLM
ncbi:hypothetical protein PILCRDRAFT_814596 [Piloderma croceum F 1598]|uniref:Uncharacterized protein n=1 Tax=Piloderma croceum (strain F 1598) TaxID=765440 RepID=A0A0C3FU49_PILCF|nr:hypothetical protein PILCRDRAFT_814596 [Piloderma croceum F 1598]